MTSLTTGEAALQLLGSKHLICIQEILGSTVGQNVDYSSCTLFRIIMDEEVGVTTDKH